jgi:hypothetical protein
MKKQFLILLITIPISATAATDFSLFGTDVSFSGFATAGFAISDKPYNYERVINNDGTFARDTLLGLQTDIKFTDEISATIQGKFAPSKEQESAWDASLIWACLSWRPSNDLLFRLGKQRAPVYMYSESMDVGITYDLARLPTEMYSTAPNTDYVGASFSKNWNIDWGELSLEGYFGRSETNWRFYQRDNIKIPTNPLMPGANYIPVQFDSTGAILTLTNDENKYRAGFHYIKIKGAGQGNQNFRTRYSLMPASFFVPKEIAPFFTGDAYTVLPENLVDEFTTVLFTLGAKYQLPNDFFLLGEYSLRFSENIETGANTNSGYISLLKEIDDWTPYVSFSIIKSTSNLLDLYQKINTHSGISVNPMVQIPMVQNAAKLLNASQRIVADGLSAIDQHTIAIGTSYSLTPTQKIKFEWARTHVGVNSFFVNAPSGSNVTNDDIDVFSFSYNVAF